MKTLTELHELVLKPLADTGFVPSHLPLAAWYVVVFAKLQLIADLLEVLPTIFSTRKLRQGLGRIHLSHRLALLEPRSVLYENQDSHSGII